MGAFTLREGLVDEIILQGFGPTTNLVAANVLVGYELTAIVLRPEYLPDVGQFMDAAREAVRTINYETEEDEFVTFQWNIDDDNDEEEILL